MKRCTASCNYYATISKDIIYSNMCNHYRRTLNAKCNIDKVPPWAHRQPKDSSFQQTAKQCEFSNKSHSKEQQVHTNYGLVTIPNDPLIPGIRRNPTQLVATKERSKSAKRNLKLGPKSHSPLSEKKVPKDLLDRNEDKFDAAAVNFKPRILKTDAESRVKNMKVYHPPRKKNDKPANMTDEKITHSWNKEFQQNYPDPNNSTSGKDSSNSSERSEQNDKLLLDEVTGEKESSRDSAYNGGISSGGESRGQTPEHYVPQIKNTTLNNVKPTTTLRAKSIEIQYLEFVHKITEEILRNGAYNDSAMIPLFTKHIDENKEKLEMDRMMQEITLMKAKFGINTLPDKFMDILTFDSLIRERMIDESTALENEVLETLKEVGFEIENQDQLAYRKICNPCPKHLKNVKNSISEEQNNDILDPLNEFKKIDVTNEDSDINLDNCIDIVTTNIEDIINLDLDFNLNDAEVQTSNIEIINKQISVQSDLINYNNWIPCSCSNDKSKDEEAKSESNEII